MNNIIRQIDGTVKIIDCSRIFWHSRRMIIYGISDDVHVIILKKLRVRIFE